jgi:hypothetical protein
MPQYDSFSFSPPAPIAKVTLLNPRTSLQTSDVPMLLDTGADVTLLPTPYLQNLGLNLDSGRKFELAGFDNQKSITTLVEIHIILSGKTVRGEYFLIDQDYGIIGRNILNLFKITFDGKSLKWEIS